MNKYLIDLLKENSMSREEREAIKEDVRNEIEELIRSNIDENVKIKYAGSIVKGTANIVDYDVDILCYFYEESKYSIKEIYQKIRDILRRKYIIEEKKSAIKITGKRNDNDWNYNVDIVPGKFTDNKEQNAYLYINKPNIERLKTNPIVQLKKVQEYDKRDLIRLYKLFRYSKGFSLKSFVLELFVIDIADKFINSNDDLKDRFISLLEVIISKLGNIKLYDPSNIANEVSSLHSENEYEIIKSYTEELIEAIKNENKERLNILFNSVISEDIKVKDYSHKIDISGFFSSTYSRLIGRQSPKINIKCVVDRRIKNRWVKGKYNGKLTLIKGTKLYFQAVPDNDLIFDDIKWLITNSGYEAEKDNCLRGKVFEQCNSYKYSRYEITKYKGIHTVQALAFRNGHIVGVSDDFEVKIR